MKDTDIRKLDENNENEKEDNSPSTDEKDNDNGFSLSLTFEAEASGTLGDADASEDAERKASSHDDADVINEDTITNKLEHGTATAKDMDACNDADDIDEDAITNKLEHGTATAKDMDAFKAYTDKLEKETEQNTRKLRKRNMIIAVIAAIAIAACAGGSYYYKARQKARFTDVVDSYYGYLEKGQLSNAVDLDAMNIRDETNMAEVGTLYKTVIEDGEKVYGDRYISEFKKFISTTVRKNYQSHRIEDVKISDDKKKATISAVTDGNSYSMMTYTGTSEITKYTAQLANGKYKSQMDAIRKSKDENNVKLAKMRNIVASDIFKKMATDRDKNDTMVLNQFKITVVKQSDGSYKISKIAYKNSGKIDGTRRDFKETKKKTTKQDAKTDTKKDSSTASAKKKSSAQ